MNQSELRKIQKVLSLRRQRTETQLKESARSCRQLEATVAQIQQTHFANRDSLLATARYQSDHARVITPAELRQVQVRSYWLVYEGDAVEEQLENATDKYNSAVQQHRDIHRQLQITQKKSDLLSERYAKSARKSLQIADLKRSGADNE